LRKIKIVPQCNLININLQGLNPTLTLRPVNLIENSEFIQSLLTNLSDGIVACDAQGKLVLLNRAAREFHGLDQESIPTEQWASYYDLYYSDGKTLMRTEDIPLVRALNGESVFGVEMKIVPQHGKARTVLTNGAPIFNLLGAKLGAVVAMRDITDYQQVASALLERNAEIIKLNEELEQRVAQRTSQLEMAIAQVDNYSQDLRESEKRFRETFEQAAVGIAHVGIDGQWLRVNQKLCDIVGYTREQLMELTFQEITHPEDLALDLAYVERLLAGKIENYSLEKRYLRRDGSIVWIELTVSLVRTCPPNEFGRSRFGWEDSHPYAQRYPLGKADRGLYRPVTAGFLPQSIIPKYFISVIEEIGDRKQAEIELQQRAEELEWLNKLLTQTTTLLKKRNEELDRFVYVASHDLKAPLRAIANLSEWIEEDLEGQLPSENQRQMELLRGRVYRLEALINGLLEYSRVGQISQAIETVHVSTLLEEVLDSLDPPSTFTIEVQGQMPTLKTKRVLLFQVFSNLISNAIKYHHRSDGQIGISYQDRGDFYEFTVADDGLGIAPEHYAKVFTIFQTLQPRDRIESTGIGLAIVKKIVETEGGEISLESKLGEGAKFRFTWLKEAVKN
jgi:PAS domain S-box-containing protein